MTKDISVYQDLILHDHSGALSDIRAALINYAKPPWRHGPDKEDEATQFSLCENVIVFIRDAGDNIEAVDLFLMQRDNGYKVTNIVPRDVSELGIQGYNSALQDFVSKVAKPASQVDAFRIKMSSERQSMKDWMPNDAAEALHRFSILANKSTGSSHPRDEERWFQFIFAAYRAPQQLDTDHLMRWLVEVEGWSDEKAHKLVIEFEFGLALLKEYDIYRA